MLNGLMWKDEAGRQGGGGGRGGGYGPLKQKEHHASLADQCQNMHGMPSAAHLHISTLEGAVHDYP